MTLYDAIVSNISAHIAVATVIDLKWHDNYEFDFFRVISQTSRIIQSEFVTPNASTHLILCASLHVCNLYFAKACPLISVGHNENCEWSLKLVVGFSP